MEERQLIRRKISSAYETKIKSYEEFLQVFGILMCSVSLIIFHVDMQCYRRGVSFYLCAVTARLFQGGSSGNFIDTPMIKL